MESNTFLNKISEIRQAIDLGLCNCALALALTIPDICGKVEYPTEIKSSQRYKAWFAVYAQSQFTVSATQLPEEEAVDYVVFSAEECWALRCAVLHAGNYETEKITLSKVHFHAHKREGKNYSHIVRDSHFADFDVIRICETLCNAAENYYSNSQRKNQFDVDEVRIDTW